MENTENQEQETAGTEEQRQEPAEQEPDLGALLKAVQAEMAGKDPEEVQEATGEEQGGEPATEEAEGKKDVQEAAQGGEDEKPPEPEKKEEPVKEDFRARIARKAAEHKRKLAEQARQIEELQKAKPDERAAKLLAAVQGGNYSEVLTALGTDLAGFNEALLTGKAPAREPSVEERVQVALAEQEKRRRSEVDAQIAQAKRGIAQQVAAHPEAELIRDLQLGDRVADVIIQELGQGREISVDQAVKEVEEYLVKRVEAKKAKKSQTAAAPAPALKPAAQPKTLTSKTAPSSAGTPKRKSERERMADAAEWVKAQRLKGETG